MSQSKIKVLLGILVFSIAGGYVFFLNIGEWLDRSSEPIDSDIIVCLSYNKVRVDRAVSLLKQGYGKKIVATTEMTYSHLLREQLTDKQIIMFPIAGSNTYEEGLLLKAYLREHTYKKILVVSDPYHLFRARWTMAHLFGKTSYQFSYVASVSRESLRFWWNNTQSRRDVLRELPSIVYYWLGHGLCGLNKNPAWVNTIKREYLDLLEEVF